MQKAIEELIDDYKFKAKQQQKFQFQYQALHYALGYPQILCTALLTFFTGATRFNWLTAIGLFGTFLSVTNVFFKLQDKAGNFKNTKLQYNDLINDLEVILQTQSDQAELEDVYKDVKEKEKYIVSYQQSPTQLCEYVCVGDRF